MECTDCDKRCSDHATKDLIIGQHGDRINSIEISVDSISNSVSKIEGRNNAFTWITGVMIFALCSIATYGVFQLNDYRDKHTIVTMKMLETLAVIKTEVKHMKENK